VPELALGMTYMIEMNVLIYVLSLLSADMWITFTLKIH
jgi:hypothetical protein